MNAVTGDAGSNIPGGKQQYRVVWDVLEDVDELYSAEFFVEATIKEDGSTITIDPSLKNKFTNVLAFNSGLIETPFGVRYALIYNEKFGVYGAARFGADVDGYYLNYFLEENQNRTMYVDSIESSYYESTFSFIGGLLLNVSQKQNYCTYVYAGVGYGQWASYEREFYVDFDYLDINNNPQHEENTEISKGADYGFEFEYGVLMTTKRLSFGLGLTHMIGWDFQTNGVASFGLKF